MLNLPICAWSSQQPVDKIQVHPGFDDASGPMQQGGGMQIEVPLDR